MHVDGSVNVPLDDGGDDDDDGDDDNDFIFHQAEGTRGSGTGPYNYKTIHDSKCPSAK